MSEPSGFLGLVTHPWNGVGPIPEELARPCRREDCGGTLRPVDGTQIFDDDGHANAFAKCDRCVSVISVFWDWTLYPEAGS